MSRTDKTAPYDVRVLYYPDWLEEYHDHRFGPCDLPPRPRKARRDPGINLWYGGKRHHDETSCYWVASYTQFWTHPLSRCSCGMCGWDGYEGRLRLKQRRQMRREAHDLRRSPWEWRED